MGDFQPDEGTIYQIEELLIAAGSGQGDYHGALNQLNDMKQHPEFFVYCSCILALEQDANKQIAREQAGYYLKNHIKFLDFNVTIKEYTFQALADSNGRVRRAASSIVTTAVENGLWPPTTIADHLIPMCGSNEACALSGGMMALSRIVEDLIDLLDSKENPYTPQIINAVVPHLNSSIPDVRECALWAMFILLEQCGADMKGPSYISLAGDGIGSVVELLLEALNNGPNEREAVTILKALVHALTFYEEMRSYFEQIGTIMLEVTENTDCDENIRKEAIEFWRAVLYFPNFSEHTKPMMERILPTILGCMPYSEIELGMLGGKEDDWEEPDKEDDIKPRHFDGRGHNEDDDDDGDEVDQWNLRRVAATALDDIAEYYGDDILDIALQQIDDMMGSDDWRVVEGGILAIGAVATGCEGGMQGYLGQIIPRLLDILGNQGTHFLVKVIALWAVSRYSAYLVENPECLEQYLKLVLDHMQNPSKMVQEAASVALGEIADACENSELSGFVVPVLETVSRCFRAYQLKNRYLLFETVQSLCQSFGSALQDDDTLNILLGPLTECWQNTANDSPMILPFFNCMCYVCDAVGPFMHPMAEELFDRCYGMIQFHVEERKRSADQNEEPPEVDYLIVALDLLSATLEAVGSTLEPTLMKNEPDFMNYIIAVCNDQEEPVLRKSAFAVIGDLCGQCINHIQSMLSDVLDSMLVNLQEAQPETLSMKVASNVAWAFGQLIANQNCDGNLATVSEEHVAGLLPEFMRILASIQTDDDRGCAENVCLAIGRIVDANSLANCGIGLEFLPVWLQYMRNIKNVPQKEEALQGVFGLVQQKPEICAESLGLWIDLFESLDPSPKVREDIKTLLLEVKNFMGHDYWNAELNKLRNQVRDQLYKKYDVR